jgi:hypothetical protein
MEGLSPFGLSPYKRNRWVMQETQELELLVRNETKVSVSLGYTMNLGNFESLRVDVGIVDYTREDEKTSEAIDRVYTLVGEKLKEKVQELKAELDN